jgi:hypothetical protein
MNPKFNLAGVRAIRGLSVPKDKFFGAERAVPRLVHKTNCNETYRRCLYDDPDQKVES